MTINVRIRHGEYYDSVTLLEIAQKVLHLPGVIDAALVMGTPANRGILANAGLFDTACEAATADDLMLVVKADDSTQGEAALDAAEAALVTSRAPKGGGDASTSKVHTIASAAQQLEAANLTLISVAGHYAAQVAHDALEHDTHVFLFSDNVSVEDEIRLKSIGRDKGLLVMGPDAGTAIINGVALGFANAILHTPPVKGGVGIVAASGTGLQAVTCELTRRGVGVTQAIGTGGRDLSDEVGGIMMIESLRALQIDPATRTILLVSKPPAQAVAEAVLEQALASHKPAVICFLGAKKKSIVTPGVIAASNLEAAAAIAAEVALGGDPKVAKKALKKRDKQLKSDAYKLRAQLGKEQRFLRGLFSGGTFCYETQIILPKILPDVAILSNAPIDQANRLDNSAVSQGHSVIDLGEDEFTQGRLHPMLDPTLRNRRIVEEARDPETAVILFDIVLGFGVHPDPAGAAVEAIREAQSHLAKKGRTVLFVAHVCGTEGDPQNLRAQEARLRDAGVIVLPTNAAASRLAGFILA